MVGDFVRFKQAVMGAPSAPRQSGDANLSAQIDELLFRVAASRLSQIKAPNNIDISIPYLRLIEQIVDSAYPAGTWPTPDDHWPQDFRDKLWTPYMMSVAPALDQLYDKHLPALQAGTTALPNGRNNCTSSGPSTRLSSVHSHCRRLRRLFGWLAIKSDMPLHTRTRTAPLQTAIGH
jgi:hypothetical protein